MNPQRALIEAAEAVLSEMDMGFWPDSIERFRAAISSAKAAEEGVETTEQIWKRAYLAGAVHVSNDLGATLFGLKIPEYSPPQSLEVREKEGYEL